MGHEPDDIASGGLSLRAPSSPSPAPATAAATAAATTADPRGPPTRAARRRAAAPEGRRQGGTPRAPASSSGSGGGNMVTLASSPDPQFLAVDSKNVLLDRRRRGRQLQHRRLGPLGPDRRRHYRDDARHGADRARRDRGRQRLRLLGRLRPDQSARHQRHEKVPLGGGTPVTLPRRPPTAAPQSASPSTRTTCITGPTATPSGRCPRRARRP